MKASRRHWRPSNGEKVPENVDTGANVITKENMDTERSKELLTPDVTK
jgi:ribose transport system substrate-binding protein